MQKAFIIVLILITFSCSFDNNKSNDKKSYDQSDITGITNIEFNEEIHDFGYLKSGEIVIFTFSFTNTGEHNLVIKDIKSDCGCVKAKFSKESIKPYQTGYIEVEFDSSGLFGKQFKSIEIHANTKELKHLAIFAEVENEQLEIKY